MIPSPLEYSESLHIGTVEFVSPNEIRVALDINAPESIALNTGFPRPFPRINEYLIIPNAEGFIVGQVEWLTTEYSPYPQRKGMRDFGLVDLPYPLRKLSLNPLGALQKKLNDEDQSAFVFKRGVNSFPSVGDSVLIPTQPQLRSIVESGKNKWVKIGTSPLAGNTDVKVNPDRLFGRHLAILGNTGSGKSCSVAGLIRWSLETAISKIEKGKKAESPNPNARFIILDPNGEYEHAFIKEKGILKPKVFKVKKIGDPDPLIIPIWLLNSIEWCSLSQASDKTQKPTLIHALRNLRSGITDQQVNESNEMRHFLQTLLSIIQIEKNKGTPWSGFPKSKNFTESLIKWRDGGLQLKDSFSDEEKNALNRLIGFITSLIEARSEQYAHHDYKKGEIDELLENLRLAITTFGGGEHLNLPMDADIPLEFTSESLLRSIDASSELLKVTEYTETMKIRIQTILNDYRMKLIIRDSEGVTLEDWLNQYLGTENCITIIDLSLVPSEIIHIATAIISRILFEALQRYRKLHKDHKILPTTLVMEEAHSFIKRYNIDTENRDSSSICCMVFEKIAREGRKFGLGLVLSSQRPSELSPTVLSQCNTFLLHRISNDRDQDLVQRFVPDYLKGILRDLPTLPSQNAILMGWATELPVLVQMNDLPKDQQPQSEDPDFWKVWIREEERDIDFKKIADDWQQISD